MADSEPGDDLAFMQLALALGRRGLGRTWPNPSVGAVVVRREADGPVIVGRGWTKPHGRPHAETQALDRAGGAARGATLYVTLEPCSHHGRTPPCADAIIAAGIARVVSALEDPNPQVAGEGHRRMAAAGIAVRVGTGAERVSSAGHGRGAPSGACARDPRTSASLAVSATAKPGSPAAARRRSPASGARRVHLMRAMNDAVLTGIGLWWPMIAATAGCPAWRTARRFASCSMVGCGWGSGTRWLATARKRRCRSSPASGAAEDRALACVRRAEVHCGSRGATANRLAAVLARLADAASRGSWSRPAHPGRRHARLRRRVDEAALRCAQQVR